MTENLFLKSVSVSTMVDKQVIKDLDNYTVLFLLFSCFTSGGIQENFQEAAEEGKVKLMEMPGKENFVCVP